MRCVGWPVISVQTWSGLYHFVLGFTDEAAEPDRAAEQHDSLVTWIRAPRDPSLRRR